MASIVDVESLVLKQFMHVNFLVGYVCTLIISVKYKQWLCIVLLLWKYTNFCLNQAVVN